MTWYGWGSCDQGQLGMGSMKQMESKPIPLKMLNDIGIKTISVGMNHSLYIADKTDELYSHGYNIEGQLAVGDYYDRCEPTPVVRLSMKRPKFAVAGPLVSFVITDDRNTRKRELWRAGLTYVDDKTFFSESKLNKVNLGNYSDATICRVFCGQYFNFLLDETGRLFSFGYSESGGLGIGSKSRKEPGIVPIELIEDETIQDLVVGWGHVLLLTSEGRVFSWGASNHGQCGHGQTKNVSQ